MVFECPAMSIAFVGWCVEFKKNPTLKNTTPAICSILFQTVTSNCFRTQVYLSHVNAPQENKSARSGEPETRLLIQSFFKIDLLTGHLL